MFGREAMASFFLVRFGGERVSGPSLIEMCAHMVWPVACPVCGMVGRVLCNACLHSLTKLTLPRCLWCGRPIPCRMHGGDAKIRAGFLYEGAVREIILMLKYGGYETLGTRLGKAMAEILAKPDAEILIPVPLHRGSRRRYNQAEAIAEGLGAVWNIEVRNAARWSREAATRTGMKKEERLALPRDVFECGTEFGGLRVALVDDVCTTGTTLACLGLACRAAGASVVDAFVAAHVPI